MSCSKGFFRLFVAMAIILCMGGCASIISESKYPVNIRSSTDGAQVAIKNRSGSTINTVETPSTVLLKASSGYFRSAKYTFEFSKPGFQPASKSLSASLDGWYLGNIIFGGLLGLLIVDPATGAMFKLDDSVDVNMLPDSTYDTSVATQKKEEIVSAEISKFTSNDFVEHAQRGTTAAVLLLDARGGIEKDAAALLTDRLSVEFEQMKVYKLVSQSKMKEILEIGNFTAMCSNVECALEAGKLLQVEYIVYGSIGCIGSMHTVNVYLACVETGSIITSVTVDIAGSIEELLTMGMNQAAGELLVKTMELQK